MAIDFYNPWMLLLLPLSILVVLYFRNAVSHMGRSKAKLVLIARCMLLSLIVLALAGVNIETRVDTISTIFTVDLSESTSNKQKEYEIFFKEALKYISEDDKVGIITFGSNSEIESSLVKNIENIEFQTEINGSYTDIEKGLKLAQALLPEDSMKRIVLITDGEENLGDSLNEGSILNYNNIDLKVLKSDRYIGEEVQISGMNIPKKLYLNQEFEITVEIYSNVKTDAKLSLYSNASLVGHKEISIEKGSNKFVFVDKAKESGLRAYKAVINAASDTITQNNEYSAFTDIAGNPNILLIDDKNDGGRELIKLLEAANLDVEHIKDTEVPQNLSKLSQYSSIILSDLSLDNISTSFLSLLKSYVRDYGGGLVVTGGENSYALGGYYKTPLEEVLPVDMEMKINGEVPNLGLMLVIDKSGSMESEQYGIKKIDIAKEAAIRAVNSLKPKDEIGVIAFDEAAQWVVELSPSDNEDEIKSYIGTIRAGGGTSIIPALNEAYIALKDSDTKLKHIILLTDGQAESVGYDQLLDNIIDAGITISTVAVGRDSDVNLLEWIANTGKGRYYFVEEVSTIPQIFTKETFLASKAYINNRRFTPNISYPHEIINPLIEGIPSLDGYIGASVKERAFEILTSDTGDPILSAWQYGLGRSVAWTSDINGKWSSEYLLSQSGNELIKNIVEWTFPTASNSNISIETKTIGEEEEIIVRNIGEFETEYKTKATIIAPDLSLYEIELDAISPGEYHGKFPISQKGVYIAKISQYKDNEIVNAGNYGIVSNYSKEYDITTSQNKLDILINKAGGKYITEPSQVFIDDLDRVYGSKDLSRLMLILALLLLLFDIALRRLNLNVNFGFTRRIKTSPLNVKDNKQIRLSKNIKPNNSKSYESEKAYNSKNKRENLSEESTEEIINKKNEKSKENKKNNLDVSRLIKAKDKRKRS